MRRRDLLSLLGACGGLALAGGLRTRTARAALPREIAEIRRRARGQTVWFDAWGGSPEINRYIAWAGERVRELYGVRLEHVRLRDTAEAVARIVAEVEAGRTEGGSIDLVWINGENFRHLKERGLLFGPITPLLENFALVDVEHNPTVLVDFTIPTDGYEAPWGTAQFVFLYDTARVPEPPRDFPALFDWIRANPGRFTHPRPPDFVGSTFLKHLLYAVGIPRERLAAPVGAADFAALARPVFDLLDGLYPHFWRRGRRFPDTQGAQHRLLADGEVDVSMSFNPAEAANLILAGRLSESVRTFVPAEGTIGNTHFLAIPVNAAHREGALTVIDFLLSPEAQARKLDPAVWGDGTVLAMEKLSPEQRALFSAVPTHPAILPPERRRPVLPEPHPDWMERMEEAWLSRYGTPG